MKRILYLIYLAEWYKHHSGSGFRGCTPPCFNEWKDCELQQGILEHPELYKSCWYYFIIKIILKEKR